MPPLIHASAAPPKIQAHFILRARQPRQGALNQAVGSGSRIRAFPGHLGRNERGTVRLSFGRTEMRNVLNNVERRLSTPTQYGVESVPHRTDSVARGARTTQPPTQSRSIQVGLRAGKPGEARDRACRACGPGASLSSVQHHLQLGQGGRGGPLGQGPGGGRRGGPRWLRGSYREGTRRVAPRQSRYLAKVPFWSCARCTS